MTNSGFRDRMSINEAMARTGASSPSAALKAHKAAIGSKRAGHTGYLPHTGAKQKAKAAARAARGAK